jgi:hypothetical protein
MINRFAPWIGILFGTYFVLLACGVIRVSSDFSVQENWRKRFGRLVGVCGFIAIVFGILSAIGEK